MEGSGAAAGTEGAAGAAEGTQGGEGAAGGLDLSGVMQHLEGLGSRMERFEQTFAQQAQGQQDGQDDGGLGGEDFDLTGLFDVDNGLDPQQAQQMLSQLMQSHTQQAIEAATAPLMERINGIQTGLDAEQLAARYPELATREGAEPVVNAARALAEHVGDPSLATNMQVIELVYKAQRADKYAAGERPAGVEQGFELERAGGAGPTAEPPNIAAGILGARAGNSFWTG